ncbi:MAG TPA: MauE/DoxX family redox-associated membrane protein, partial [Sphingobacterium sp.]|nr:MauE/DoxX family redox-associated membrane protein [Sphingobacterium sp.]
LEIAVVIMLIRPKWRPGGFRLSSLLMAAFTAYIGVALLGAWEKLPCGCGSVISGMSWQQHFWFNVFFLIISLVGWSWHKNISTPPSTRLTSKVQKPDRYIHTSNSRPIRLFHTWNVIKLFRRKFAPFPGRPVDI